MSTSEPLFGSALGWLFQMIVGFALIVAFVLALAYLITHRGDENEGKEDT